MPQRVASPRGSEVSLVDVEWQTRSQVQGRFSLPTYASNYFSQRSSYGYPFFFANPLNGRSQPVLCLYWKYRVVCAKVRPCLVTPPRWWAQDKRNRFPAIDLARCGSANLRRRPGLCGEASDPLTAPKVNLTCGYAVERHFSFLLDTFCPFCVERGRLLLWQHPPPFVHAGLPARSCPPPSVFYLRLLSPHPADMCSVAAALPFYKICSLGHLNCGPTC